MSFSDIQVPYLDLKYTYRDVNLPYADIIKAYFASF